MSYVVWLISCSPQTRATHRESLPAIRRPPSARERIQPGPGVAALEWTEGGPAVVAGPPPELDQFGWITMLPPPSAVEAGPSSGSPIWLS